MIHIELISSVNLGKAVVKCSLIALNFSCAVVFLLFMLLPTSRAATPDFAALVIGNQRYEMSPLETPEADASAIAEQLGKVGYQVTKLLNLRQTELYDAIDTFFLRHRNTNVLLFFYAGHGVQINGKNFLIPVEIKRDAPDLLSQLFDLRYLMTKLKESKSKVKLVILDACRDNIFTNNPSAASGLSELISPPDTFFAFSTAPGSTAQDGDGVNSPYTSALLEQLFRPNVKIEDAFKSVRKKVRFITENEQTPWESTSLVEDFYMVPYTNELIKSKSIKSFNLIEKKHCAKLFVKLSMGVDLLSEDENKYLLKCSN